MALACATLLTPAALCACALGLWRIAADVGVAGGFAITSGLFSHWQVWLGGAALIEFFSFALNRYGSSANLLQQSVLQVRVQESVLPKTERGTGERILNSGF